ncbi:MAG: pentapeptide repeat-containing protein [Oscillospiraceae bacterium]|nr:pentapeptide repeat-containing protein [Oscillospiraceae bacterium]
MDERFTERANALLNERLFKTEDLFLGEFSCLSAEFKKNFAQICGEIAKLQENGDFGDVAYIGYTMLRTNLINKEYATEVCIYGENWYLCKNQRAVGQFDISVLFRYFDELWQELIAVRKQYIGKVSAQEVTAFIMQEAAPKFYSYVTVLCRFSILECVGQNYFGAIKKTPRFQINSGEYMARTESVYKENTQKNRDEILSWFDDRLDYEYCFEDFSGLDFSNENLAKIDCRYADFRNADLKNVNFNYANLIGARFCGADLENADFSYALLYEADFSGANLKNAKLENAFVKFENQEKDVWKRPGFMAVNFTGAIRD